MRTILFIVFSLLTLAQAPLMAVNPRIPIEKIDEEHGFIDTSAIQGQIPGITEFVLKVDPKVFQSQCRYLGVFGAPKIFHVSLSALNTGEFKGVTVPLGRFGINDSEFSVSFDVPTQHLSNYELVFAGATAGGHEIPAFSNGTYTTTLKAVREAPDTIDEDDFAKLIKEAEDKR